MRRTVLFIIHCVDFIDNFAVACLGSIASENGWNCHCIVYDPQTIDDIMAELQPAVVAYSAMTADAEIYLEINRRIRERHRFISIMGGGHPTYFPEVIRDEGIDFICVGEGEGAFRDFLVTLESGGDIDSIANIHSKRRANPTRPLIQDLDSLPLPDRSLIYDSTELGESPLKTFMASRGCPYSCSYCYNNALQKEYRGKGKYYRSRSPEKLVEEIGQIKKKYRLDFVKFEDDLFAAHPQWLKEFSEIYPAQIGIPFNCLQRLEQINETRVHLLKAAGCRSISLSLDNGDITIRNDILNRGMRFTNDEIVARTRLIKEAGISIMTSTMLGVPTSSRQTDMAGIQLNIDAGIDFAGAPILMPFQGTDIYRYCTENNLITPGIEKDNISLQQRSLLNCFTDDEKDIQWNLSVFYPAIVRFRILRPFLIWISFNTKPRDIYALFHVLVKAYLMDRYIYPTHCGLITKFKMLFKAFAIEMGRMRGKASQATASASATYPVQRRKPTLQQ